MLRFQNSNRKPNGSSGSSVLTLNSAWNSPIHTGLFQAANSSSSTTTTATATTTTTTVNSNTPTTTTLSPAHTTHSSSIKANGMSSPHSSNTSSSATYNNSTTNNDNNNNNNNNNNNSNNSNNLKLIDTLNNTSSSNTSSTNANTTPNMSALYDNYNTTNGGTTTQNIAGSNQSSVTSIKKPFAINGNNNNNNNNNNNTTSLTSSSSMVSSQQPNTFSLNNSSTTNTTSDIGLSSSHSNNNNNTASSSILESIPIPTSPTSTSTTLNTNTIFATPTIPSSTTTTTTTSSTTTTTTTATATTPSQSKANSKPRPKTLIEAADKLLSCPNFSQYLSNEQKLSLLWTLHSSSNSIGSSSSSISSTTSSGITPLSPTLASTSTVPFSSHDPTSASSTAQLSIELVPSSSLLSEHVKKQGFNPYIRWSKINNGEKQSIISNDLKLLPPKELRSTPTSSSKEKSSNIGFYWSEDNIGNATINQLYSTLQCPSPFVIEYDWAMTELASSLNSSHAVVPEIVSTTTSNATTSSSLLFCNEHSLSSEDAAQASWLTTSTSTSTSISTSTSTATALNTNQSERLPTTSGVSNNQTKHPIPILPEISISKSTLLSTDTTLNQPVHFALTGDYSTDGFTSKIFGGINDSNSNFGHLKPASSQKSNLLFENNESLGFSSIFDSSYDVSLGTLIGTSGSKKSNGGGISGGGVSESLKVNGTASSVKFNHNNNSTNSNSNSSSNNNNSNNNNNNNNDNSNNNNTNNNNNNKNSNNTNNNTNNGTAFSTDHLLGFGENSFDAVFSAEGLLNTDDSTFGLASNIIQSYNKTNTPSPMQTKSPGNHQSPNQVWGPFIQDFSSRTNSKKRSLDEPLNPLNKQIRLSVGNDL